MAYKDLREFITELEKEGELHRIKTEVDWDLEIGTIMRKIFEINGPACLFERVKDTRFPILSGALFGFKRYGLAIGAPPDLRAILKKVLEATKKPVAPVLVSKSRCKENIDTGDKINLEQFPAPRWFHLDGGRYIGTLGVVITKDPETGIRNMGIYRLQMKGKDKLAMLGTQQIGIHFQKYRAQKKDMPVAVAIGVPPAVLAAAALQVPYGEDELGIAGAMVGEPIPLVKCETVDLEIPAHSEAVFEGEMVLDENRWEMEGPFGEFPGHVSDRKPMKRPTIFLKAITYRDNPIFQGTSPGVPPNEDIAMRTVGHTIGAWRKLLRSGVQGVKEVHTTEMGCASFTIIVSLDRQYYLGNVRQVINAIWATVYAGKWVIVVDDDIDIYDSGQVEWALATRVQPHRDIMITDSRYPGVSLDPSRSPEIRETVLNVGGSRIGIDATTKFKGFEFPPVVRSSEEQKKLVERRWKEYGLK